MKTDSKQSKNIITFKNIDNDDKISSCYHNNKDCDYELSRHHHDSKDFDPITSSSSSSSLHSQKNPDETKFDTDRFLLFPIPLNPCKPLNQNLIDRILNSLNNLLNDYPEYYDLRNQNSNQHKKILQILQQRKPQSNNTTRKKLLYKFLTIHKNKTFFLHPLLLLL